MEFLSITILLSIYNKLHKNIFLDFNINNHYVVTLGLVKFEEKMFVLKIRLIIHTYSFKVWWANKKVTFNVYQYMQWNRLVLSINSSFVPFYIPDRWYLNTNVVWHIIDIEAIDRIWFQPVTSLSISTNYRDTWKVDWNYSVIGFNMEVI